VLGVGVIYWPQLAPLLEGCGELVEVLKIESRFLWLEPGHVGQNTAL